MSSQTRAIVGNSCTDGWYFVVIGTNQLWESYLHRRDQNFYWSSSEWVESKRYGGTGGLYRVYQCLTEMQCAAFRIAAITGMQIKDEIDYNNLWTYSTTPPKMKITLNFPGDKLHENDIVLEGFCHTFVPRPQKKKELKRKYGKPC